MPYPNFLIRFDAPSGAVFYFNQVSQKDINSKTDIYVSGWGLCGDIFLSYLSLEASSRSFLVVDSYYTSSFNDDLDIAFDHFRIRGDFFTFHGMSMGGYLVMDYLHKQRQYNPETYLYGVRPSYPDSVIKKLKKMVQRDYKRALIWFYDQLFHKSISMDFFKEEYMESYLSFFDSERLINDLDFLGAQRLNAEMINLFKELHFVHGKHDKIAPLEELEAFGKDLNLNIEVVENNGHLLDF